MTLNDHLPLSAPDRSGGVTPPLPCVTCRAMVMMEILQWEGRYTRPIDISDDENAMASLRCPHCAGVVAVTYCGEDSGTDHAVWLGGAAPLRWSVESRVVHRPGESYAVYLEHEEGPDDPPPPPLGSRRHRAKTTASLIAGPPVKIRLGPRAKEPKSGSKGAALGGGSARGRAAP